MANKPAERITQAITPGRMNVYVNGAFRAQLNDDAARAYAYNEMRKGADVVLSRKQWDMAEYRNA